MTGCIYRFAVDKNGCSDFGSYTSLEFDKGTVLPYYRRSESIVVFIIVTAYINGAFGYIKGIGIQER